MNTIPINITIRRLISDDWQDLRRVRLKALKLHPGLFLTNYSDTQQHSEAEWRQSLDNQDQAIFGLFDGAQLVGITGVKTCGKDTSGQTGVMVMSFIDPAHRGRGYTDYLYKARIDFALSHKRWTKLKVSHRAGNAPSKRAILRHGFQFTHTKEVDWPDKSRDIEYCYAMDLEKKQAS